MKNRITRDGKGKICQLDGEHVVDGFCVLLAGMLLEEQTGGVIRPFAELEREILNAAAADGLIASRDSARVA